MPAPAPIAGRTFPSSLNDGMDHELTTDATEYTIMKARPIADSLGGLRSLSRGNSLLICVAQYDRTTSVDGLGTLSGRH